MRNLFNFSVAELASPQVFEFDEEGSITTVAMANTDDVTGGTITLRFAQSGSDVFETPTGENTIDLAAPTSITVVNSGIGKVEVSLSGFTGTATDLFFTVINHA